MSPSRRQSVVLVNPPPTPEQQHGPLAQILKNLFFNSPPLGLASIAAVLERAGIPVRIIDAGAEGLGFATTLDWLKELNPTVVGLGTSSIFFANAVRLAQAIREALPGVHIVVGGPHVSSCSDDVMTYDCFDVAVVGEGEMTMLEVVTALGEGELPREVAGCLYRDGEEVVVNPRRPLLQDLDSLPLPARHLLPMGKYIPQPNDGLYLPKHAMISSRGCPYRCTFCDHGTYGVSYRSFSPGRIVNEMEELVHRYGARDIAFVDSLFMLNQKRVYNIIDEIQRRNVKVHWTCTVRANATTPAILEDMKKAGCWRVRLGAEAGNDEVLKFIRKEVTKDQIRAVADAADRAGLHPKAFFMIGHPTETEAHILETIEFAKSLPLTDITVQINTPLPGAEQWETMDEHGVRATLDWGHYSFWEPVYVPNGLSRERLEALHKKFYRDFYFRPATVWRHLRMLRSLEDVRRFARAGLILAGMFKPTRNTTEST
jgi:anaerobic magnesium-protoporphyrin IX monomethyl ester cyclase